MDNIFFGAAIPPSPSSVDDKPRTFAIRKWRLNSSVRAHADADNKKALGDKCKVLYFNSRFVFLKINNYKVIL